MLQSIASSWGLSSQPSSDTLVYIDALMGYNAVVGDQSAAEASDQHQYQRH